MKRKVIKIGTSAGFIIPQSALKERDLKIGDEADVFVGKHSKNVGELKVNQEALVWADHFIEKYKPLLEKLQDA